MPVIETKENRVVALPPKDDDQFFQIMWLGPAAGLDDPFAAQFRGPPQPMEAYQAAIDWAVDIADQMRFPLYVIPLSNAEVLDSQEIRRVVASLTSDQRGELRRLAVATLARVMRDSSDAKLRAEAYDQLTNMGVVRP